MLDMASPAEGYDCTGFYSTGSYFSVAALPKRCKVHIIG